MYAIVGTTEYYGPSTQNRVVAFAIAKADLEAHIYTLERAQCAEYGCVMLSHNQASAESFAIRRVPYQGTYCGYDVPNITKSDGVVLA